jgi:hypothetical protein
MTISRQTRKNIVDWLTVEEVPWSGRLSEERFLDRVVDLDALTSTDPRYGTARADIRQHRVNNYDWAEDWIYSYEPLSLLATTDAVFGSFLTEMLHPVVRPDSAAARTLARELNAFLRGDGAELFEASVIGDRPVWSVRAIDPRSNATGGAEASHRATEEPGRIWEAGLFRLFLSHVSAHKIQVSRLKAELSAYGVSAFVAHEDIEPSLEWQSEIEFALTSMHAFVTLLTVDFHASKWTDQEVGIAIGRGALVIPVRLPENPYGFIAKHQALRGDLAKPAELASAIVDVLLRRPETEHRMREGLVRALEKSPSFAATKAISMKIVGVSRFSSDQISRIEVAVSANSQVANYAGRNRLQRYILDMRGADR